MIIDEKLLFVNNADFYLASHTSDILEFGGDVIGEGNQIEFFILVTTAYAGGGTIQFKLQGSADGSTYKDIFMTPEYTASDLEAGTVIQLPVPDAKGYSYFKIVPVIDDNGGNAPFTAGKILAGLNLG